MSADAARVGRFYTTARRHPWVLGKVADWRIPLGPYTPAQIALAVGGGFLLVKTIAWWTWMGPVPVVAWLLAVWAVRQPKIRGRAPLQAAFGWALLAWQPRGGRIGGRAARDRTPRALLGAFTIEGAPPRRPTASAASPAAAGRRLPVRRPSRGGRPGPAAAVTPAAPKSGVQHLLALSQRGGGVR
ncbi:hypothetical protein [Streptomyces sp. NPDC094468]|uniref:hypothetical protein n=1 Tax=Streptomyces sp. NPDC094468 TaxID=3366066 RepID=UPI0038296DF6